MEFLDVLKTFFLDSNTLGFFLIYILKHFILMGNVFSRLLLPARPTAPPQVPVRRAILVMRLLFV